MGRKFLALQSQRNQQLVLAGILTACVVLLLWFNSGSPKKPSAPSSICRHLAALQVCSHRTSIAGLSATTHNTPFVERFALLASQGIVCYEVDTIYTHDGRLIVAYPADALEALAAAGAQNVTDPESVDWDEYQRLGLASRFPELSQVVSAFKSVLTTAAAAQPSSSSSSSSSGKDVQGRVHQQRQRPCLYIEPKGSARSTNGIEAISQLCSGAGADEYVTIRVERDVAAPDNTTTPALALRNRLASAGSRVAFVHVYQDAVLLANGTWEPLHGELRDGDVAAYHEFAPSWKHRLEFLTELARTGKPLMPWTVDDEQALDKVVGAGATRILSNVPLSMVAQVARRLQKCHHNDGGGGRRNARARR